MQLQGARCLFRCRCRSRHVSTHHPRHRNETIIKIDHFQTPKDPAAVAVISTPTLARSLTCFAWLFSQAVRLESFLRILGQLWLSKASCFQIHRCQKPMHET